MGSLHDDTGAYTQSRQPYIPGGNDHQHRSAEERIKTAQKRTGALKNPPQTDPEGDLSLMDEVVPGHLGGADCPESLDTLAAAKVHLRNKDGAVGIDSLNNRNMAHAPCGVCPCIRLQDCAH